MRKFIISACLGIASLGMAQAPANYYDGTSTLTGYALKTKLSSIITAGHQDKGYDGLYDIYPTSDTDKYYENDGTVLDMYSENPTGKDPYNFSHGQKKCGQYKVEGDCYNREHSIPQSVFGSARPMVSDAHHVVPTDGKVNGMRSNFPHGMVASIKSTSLNGSKLGTSAVPGFNGTVFEPIDEFKGDIARIYFYFVTRYEDKVAGYSYGMFNGSKNQAFTNGFLAMLLQWHAQDPVSQREIDRNNAIYAIQKNRNPYIDNPNWVNVIWGGGTTTPDSQAPTTPTNLASSNITAKTATLTWTASTDNIAVASYDIYMNGALKASSYTNTINILGLSPVTSYSFYVKAKDAAGNVSAESAGISLTTLQDDGNTNNGTTCGAEDFDLIPVPSTPPASQYLDREWSNRGIVWTAVNARTDKQIYIGGDTNKAICLKKGSLKSSTISGGIGSLKVKTYLPFADSAGNYTLKINGNVVGQIPYSKTAKTFTISDINIEGNFTIEIVDDATNNRVSFDDLSWNCYEKLATTEVAKSNISVYPNPVKNHELFVKGDNLSNIQNAKIYSVDGKLVQTINQPFKSSNKINLKNLPKGLYVLKTENFSTKFIVD